MIGRIVAIFTTGAFIPQIVKVIKTKNTSALSLGMSSMKVFGVFLWLIYGINIKDIALIGTKSFAFCLSVIILGYKIKYK